MKRSILIIMASAFAALTLASCNADKGYDLSEYRISLAVVENPGNNNAFYFDTDNGERMWTATTLPGYSPQDGQRVLVKYTVISDAGEGYDHMVRLLGIRDVLTKPVEYITAENEAEVGNDPIYIEDFWFGGGYLNAEFVFWRYNQRHLISLVVNEDKVYDDGKIHLEFRHNAFRDNKSVLNWGLVSFDVEPLGLPDSEATIVIHYRDENANGAEKTRELDYTPVDTVDEQKSFRHDESFGLYSFN